tara:strand:- start:5811 stop:7373 length:1563 start_codon:yes stop_codon:yes gene_type:complete
MATRRTTNPFTSANLGSGARTTTGGSYRNPRLGIQDYTAFGKGFASGFIMPKLDKKEEERLMDPIKFEPRDQNVLTMDSEGNLQSLDYGSGAKLEKNTDYISIQDLAKKPKGSDEYKLSNSVITGWEQNFGNQENSNFNILNNAVENYANTDLNISANRGKVFLPGLDGSNTKTTVGDLYGGLNNGLYKKDYRIKDGILYTGLSKTDGSGEFINMSLVTQTWVDDRYKDKFDLSLHVLDNKKYAEPYKFESIDNTTTTFLNEGGKEFKVAEESKYYKKNDLDMFDAKAAKPYAADALRFAINNQTIESLENQVFSMIKDEKFKISENAEKIGKSKGEDSVDFRNYVIKEYLEEEYKIMQGSEYYQLDSVTGRAIPKTAENAFKFEKSRVEQKPEGETSFTPEDTTELASEIKSYFKGVFENFELNELTGENVEKNRLLNMTIDHPVYGKGQITDVGATEGMLRIGITTKDSGFEPEINYVTYNSGDVEDLLDHTSYFNLPLLQGQANATNRNNLLQELKK